MTATTTIPNDAHLTLPEMPPALRAAVEAVPRELFVDPQVRPQVWSIDPVVLPAGTTLRPAHVAASLLLCADVHPGQNVLLIGAATGWEAAVLDRLGAEVVVVERLPARAAAARAALDENGFDRVRVFESDGAFGYPQAAPYDVIIVLASDFSIPRTLLDQLRPGASLVALARDINGILRRIVRVTHHGDRFDEAVAMEVSGSRRLGDILVSLGAVPRPRVEDAVTAGRASGQRLGEVLVQRNEVADDDLCRALAAQAGLRFARAEELMRHMEPELAQRVPRAFLEHYDLIPIRKVGAVIEVATTESRASTYEVQRGLGAAQVDLVLVTPTDFRRMWSVVDLGGVAPPPSPIDTAVADEEIDLLAEYEGDRGEEAYFVQLFDALMLHAIGARASDIHLEQYRDTVRVRFRVDGDLLDFRHVRLTPRELSGVINVLKIASNLDISEKRLPQGGRFRRRAGGATYDLRVQTQPCLYSEHAVIRLLPQDSGLLTIEDLGLMPEVASQYRRLLESPAGMILIVGPTGSGKSTTVYAGVQVLARDATRKVITIEDPIEYAVAGIQQTQVSRRIGFNFADAMRSFVRQDPDVIIVGEVRDQETALEAIRASQTGHVVITTLHSNDATDAVQRLFDLQQHPNSIASELLAVLAQRLAKRICDRCSEPAELEPHIVQEVFPDGVPEGFVAFKGRGCSRCNGKGTHGRVAVAEFLRLNAEVRKAISRQPPVDVLRELALQHGLLSMRWAALQLVRQGRIPFSELPNILPAERMAEESVLPLEVTPVP